MADQRAVFFFDIDNTLYSKNKNIQYMMGELIDEFFMSHLSISREDANHLHMSYYKDYGLAIEGLVRYHKVDPLEYNAKVDDALPLEGLITPDPQLRELLQSFDTTKVKLWLFTNAFINHGKRVTKLLEVDDLFEGITYCDYEAKTLICKPHEEMFARARREANVESLDQCFFIDDSALNCRAADALGWTTVHYVEPSVDPPEDKVAKYQVRSLEELRDIFPQFFKKTESLTNGA